jgi:hypothetical protein
MVEFCYELFHFDDGLGSYGSMVLSRRENPKS